MASLLRSEAARRAALITVTQMAVDLDLTSGDDGTFNSVTTIDFDVATPGSASFADFKGVRLLKAELNGVSLDVGTWQDGRLPLEGLAAHNRLVVKGVMAYSSTGEGLHRHIDPADGQTYLYAMSFLDAAPRWFACFDQPDLKAPYRFSVTAPPKWLVRGNGPARQTAPGRWLIEQPCPLATYFVTLAAGPWALVEDEYDGIPLGLLARQSLAKELAREAADILAVTKTCLGAYHAMFARRYPYGDYVQAFVPDFNAGAMENPGCITLRDQYLLRGRPTTMERAGRAGVIAHEMAHQWFGDLVTMRWWDDLWLNESFAEYMGHRVTSEYTGYDLWTQFGIVRQAWGASADQGPGSHPVAVNGADDAQGALADFDGISYAKGASLLRQLAAAMGDDVFLAGLRAYFTAHQFGNATLDDLLAAWQAAGATGLEAFADEWLRTSGMDLASVSPDGRQLLVTPGRHGLAGEPTSGLSFDIVALAADGKELSRARLDGVLPGGRELPPPPDGADIVVPDADGLCWVRRRPSNWDFPPIAQVGDPATRVVLYNAIRDGVRNGGLPVATALQLLGQGLPGETSDDIVADMLGFAVSLAGVWSPWGTRRRRLDELAGAISRQLAGAEPGSDRQMILARALARCSGDTGYLARWLEPEKYQAELRGLEPDPDLRWAVVTQLVALGGQAGLIEAELAHDPAGADKAAGARAARPSPQAKRAALDALLQPSDKRAYELYAVAEQIWQPGQEELCAPFAQEWFAGIGATATFRQGWPLTRLARASFPLVLAAPATLEQAQTCLAGAGDARLRRELAECTDLLARIVRAQQ